MTKIRKFGVLFIASLAAGAALGAAGGASAWFVRQHASNCYTLGGAPVDNNFGIQNESTGSALTILCAAADSTSTPKEATAALNVHADDYSTTGSVFAAACRSTWDVVGGACGPQYASGNAPQPVINQPITTNTVWTAARASDFGYVLVSLPAKVGANRSSFRGIFQTN